MAIYLEFVKEEESATEVVYRFGGAEAPRAHLVSIPKGDPSTAALPTGISPALSGRVIGRTASLADQEGAWPERGLVQS